ncbi:Acetyltransferase (GNAT) domain-containing protein [Lentzea waywayandensis]|uniref:Acetyltransferase (GNAT) domain-containing protein n=1 Tax=Lentzea waywayandensis TaxID=84724 RepID=A0A1I6ERF5_9PSEU|nr:GNAT family N-acetyltransferase [Lentzea waywayandensis]SFR20088.1 Acetyltransferase (GNAT) domain-containing protein [Lentzea waywayandensis]
MEIRTSRPEDLPQIEKLVVSRMDPSDGDDARLLMTDPDAGCDWVGVADDGGRIVSTLTLMDETVTLAGVDIPAGQIEQVATDTEYEGKGLVRQLMDWANDRSAERGHLLQFVMGVPYFYRQFGYTYSIPIKQTRPLVTKPEAVAGHTIRRATEADIPVLNQLQDAAQQSADLRVGHGTPCWRWLIDRTGSVTWIVERDGTAVATGRSTPEEEGDVVLGEIAGIDDDAVKALVALVNPAEVGERHAALEDHLGARRADLDQYMVRIPSIPKLLEHLRPVFAQRLRGHDPDEVVLGFYRTHVRFRWDGEEIGPYAWGGTLLGPGSQGGAGIAPDLLAPLLFGPHGMDGLRRRFSDVYPGPKEDLMTRLFPPVTSDFLTFYLP